MLRVSSLTVALLLVLSLAAAPAHAQIYVDTDATGANDGSSWADAYTDLQTAIDNASGADSLWVAEGVYTPDSEGDSFTITGNKDGIEIYGGFDGTESRRTDREPETHRTILSGDVGGDDTDPDGDGVIENTGDLNGANANHVLVVDGGNSIGSDVSANVTTSTVIDGVTVTAGQATGEGNANAAGALFCDAVGSGNECSPALRSMRFVGNVAGFAGAIVLGSTDGGTTSPTFEDVVFANNRAVEGSGGAVEVAVFDGAAARPTFKNVAFVDNRAKENAGALWNRTAGSTSNLEATFTNAVFAGNRAGLLGGALYVESGRNEATFTNATFVENTAGEEGGAIYNQGTFTGSPKEVTIANSIFWGNEAANGGDVLFNWEESAQAVLSHTIVEGQTSKIRDARGSSTTYLDESGTGTSFASSTNFAEDPNLKDASAPRGTDGRLATPDDGTNLAPGSPALDAGDNAAVPSGVTEDLTGAARVQDQGTGTPTVNLGAYEALETTAPTVTTDTVENVGFTTADLVGRISPGGEQTTVEAEVYPTDTPSNVRTVTADASPLSRQFTEVPVTVSIDGLSEGVEYAVRFVASNSEGTTQGREIIITTEEKTAPAATTEAPTNVGVTTATFNGTVNPNNLETTVDFEYRRAGTGSFSSVRAAESPLTGSSAQAVSAAADSLRPLTDYEVRVTASNPEGTDTGALTTVTTDTADVAITEGGSEGLNRTFQATAGEANQPVGVFRLTPQQGSIGLGGVAIALSESGGLGVDSLALWISADSTFDAEVDTRLGGVDTNPGTSALPDTLTVDRFSRTLPAEARHLFLTATLADVAEGQPSGELAGEAALTLRRGAIATVNGQAQTGFSSLPLTAQPSRDVLFVDDDASGANDGSSWTDAYTDLQTAINNAFFGSEIWVAEGVYTPDNEGDSFTILGPKDGIEIYGGFEGTESIRSAREPKTHRTILSGDIARDDTDPDGDGIIEDAVPNTGTFPENLNGENADHVLVLNGGTGIGADVRANITSSTVIDGLVVTAGWADDTFGADEDGAGLFCDGRGSDNACSPELEDVVFAGNAAKNAGGAIYNGGGSSGSASPSMTNVLFAGNAARSNGGAIYNGGDSLGTASPQIANATFTDNSAVEGGAIYNDGASEGSASPPITNATFTENWAVEGGAIYNDGFRGTANPQVITATFTGNVAADFGGAIYNFGFGDGTASPQVTNATFTGNTAGDGGAIYNDGQDGTSSPEITNATFNSNRASNSGGAIFNSGTFGGTARPRIANTILWGNTADSSGAEIFNDDTDNAPPVLTHTIIKGGVDGSGVGGDSNTDGGGNLDQDPNFHDTSAVAGPDGVYATQDDGLTVEAGSPAIDAGDNDAVPSGVSSDLVGAQRIQDGDGDGTATVTLGAYELSFAVGVALTGGGAGGLDRTFTATPGEADQPVGVFRLVPGQSGVDLSEVSVTPDNPGVDGVDRVRLWISDDDAFSPADDRELASTDLDPQTDLPSPMTFGGFTERLPESARTLFVTVTLTDDAEGQVTGFLDDETALALDGGAITAVNGSSQDVFTNLPLSREATPLPVEMAGFEGTLVEEGAQLRWQTASETNNAGFRVERTGEGANGGEGAWTEVGFVEGSGTTSEAQTYRFTDDDLPYEADSLRYRLTQVDTDGTTHRTDPVTIARSGPGGLRLLGTAPNPARRQATVRFAVPEDTKASQVTMRLYDVLGRRVRTVEARAEAGRHEQRLDLGGLSSGMYFLRLQAGGQVKTRKLTVVQ